jgi:hypothetical protein
MSIFKRSRIVANLLTPLFEPVKKNGCINYHPQSGWLEFVRCFMADKGKRTSVLSTLNLHPGAKHPVCFARTNLRQTAAKTLARS